MLNALFALYCLSTWSRDLKRRLACLLLHLWRVHKNVLGLKDERHSILVLDDFECRGAGKSVEVNVVN